jgi:cell division septation protein DedD
VAPTQDDAFHEIQLNGKQLVFLFMAATVVSVVIFLCGVLVGRNVRNERASNESPSSTAIDLPTPGPAPSSDVPTPTYTQLDKPTSKVESPKPSEPPAREPDVRADTTASSKPPKTAAATPPAVETERPAPPAPAPEKSEPRAVGTATPGEPAGQGFAVQIAAVNAKSEADAMAKRLASKGYSAYVLAPASGTPSVFRVRVGKFGTKREAETVAAKLQKEEQLKPWVTR